jgi:S-formylglutathione hydrolase
MLKCKSHFQKEICAVICLLFALLVLSPETASAQGTLVRQTFHSKSLEANFLGDSPDRAVAIYLPPGYTENIQESYPVIYLLHGYTHTQTTWLKLGNLNMDIKSILDDLCARNIIKPMIVVMPNGYNKYLGSWYTNSSVTGNWEDYIVEDLVAYIDSTYRTLAQRESRGIAGHSMGGTGAFKLAMKHPDVFSAVFSLSAGFISFEHSIMGQGYKPFLIQAAKETDPAKFATLYWKVRVAIAAAAAFAPNKNRLPYYGDFPVNFDGGLIDTNWTKWLEHDAYTMIDSYKDNLSQLSGIWIECGTNDDLYLSNKMTGQALDSAGIAYTWDEYNGDHINMIGARIEQKMLPFFSDTLSSVSNLNLTNSYPPTKLLLMQNYPNPFNPSTMIKYQLPMTSYVDLSIYNLLGQKMVTLISERQSSGSYQVEWVASEYSSGVYLYRLQTGKNFETKKMVLMR